MINPHLAFLTSLQKDSFAYFVHEVNEANGLVADKPVLAEVEPFYLWPENVPAWQLFQRCGTQWRSSMARREGLDYAGVQVVMGMGPIRPRQRRQRFAELQVMESAALRAWAEQETKK